MRTGEVLAHGVVVIYYIGSVIGCTEEFIFCKFRPMVAYLGPMPNNSQIGLYHIVIINIVVCRHLFNIFPLTVLDIFSLPNGGNCTIVSYIHMWLQVDISLKYVQYCIRCVYCTYTNSQGISPISKTTKPTKVKSLNSNLFSIIILLCLLSMLRNGNWERLVYFAAWKTYCLLITVKPVILNKISLYSHTVKDVIIFITVMKETFLKQMLSWVRLIRSSQVIPFSSEGQPHLT